MSAARPQKQTIIYNTLTHGQHFSPVPARILPRERRHLPWCRQGNAPRTAHCPRVPFSKDKSVFTYLRFFMGVLKDSDPMQRDALLDFINGELRSLLQRADRRDPSDPLFSPPQSGQGKK